MKHALSGLILFSGSMATAGFTLQEAMDSLTLRYDRISSYRAHADIFMYDG